MEDYADMHPNDINKEELENFTGNFKRAIQCYEACDGIPTESLGEVKKAWLAWELSRSTSEHTFNYAVQRRKEGRDYGELNALLDSVEQKER